jgi:ribosomal protein S18 acetylase RimI-like enzyme
VNHSIRPATAADAAAILGLIRELAEYENLLDACVATEALLRRNLFGEGGERVAEALVAEAPGAATVVGYAIFLKTFSTFLALPGIYLEDIYVQPAWRGRGIGKAMLREIARLAVERGYGRVEWSVLDWNAPSIAFYKKLGAEGLEEWTMYRLTGEKLRAFGGGVAGGASGAAGS